MGRKGKEAISLGPALLGGEVNESEISQAQRNSWGVSSSNYILETPPWSQNLGKCVPLADLKTTGTNKKVVRNLDSVCEEFVEATTRLLTHKTRQRKHVEITQDAGCFPITIPGHDLTHSECLL